MLYMDVNSKKYYLLNDSDNYGFDCYSFDENKNPDDGFIPFSADMCCCNTKEEYDEEQALIDKWNEEMTEAEQIDFCLKGMGTSLDRCVRIEDEELEEELFEKV